MRRKDLRWGIRDFRRTKPWQHSDENRCEGWSVRRGRLYKGRVHGRHGLAAFLAVLVAAR
jgi:hypothetical protein